MLCHVKVDITPSTAQKCIAKQTTWVSNVTRPMEVQTAKIPQMVKFVVDT